MGTQTRLIMRRVGRIEGWEHEEKSSYNVETLKKEYRQRLYSEKGLELLKSLAATDEKCDQEK